MRTYSFDLELNDTFMAMLLSREAISYTIVFGYHHIIMDGVSRQVLLQDLAQIFNDSNRPVLIPMQPTAVSREQRANLYTEPTPIDSSSGGRISQLYRSLYPCSLVVKDVD
ncbi:hypothetical protein F5B18DRAFT_604946 [Nemania serpens]|nr:hypothetical protein F5B18DRAFT_604946 [Nemania serpens]